MPRQPAARVGHGPELALGHRLGAVHGLEGQDGCVEVGGQEQEVRKVIEKSTKRLADRAWSLWRDEGMPSALEGALSVSKESATAAGASLRSVGQAITTTLDRLSGVLAKLDVAA